MFARARKKVADNTPHAQFNPENREANRKGIIYGLLKGPGFYVRI